MGVKLFHQRFHYKLNYTAKYAQVATACRPFFPLFRPFFNFFFLFNYKLFLPAFVPTCFSQSGTGCCQPCKKFMTCVELVTSYSNSSDIAYWEQPCSSLAQHTFHNSAREQFATSLKINSLWWFDEITHCYNSLTDLM